MMFSIWHFNQEFRSKYKGLNISEITRIIKKVFNLFDSTIPIDWFYMMKIYIFSSDHYGEKQFTLKVSYFRVIIFRDRLY